MEAFSRQGHRGVKERKMCCLEAAAECNIHTSDVSVSAGHLLVCPSGNVQLWELFSQTWHLEIMSAF